MIKRLTLFSKVYWFNYNKAYYFCGINYYRYVQNKRNLRRKRHFSKKLS